MKVLIFFSEKNFHILYGQVLCNVVFILAIRKSLASSFNLQGIKSARHCERYVLGSLSKLLEIYMSRAMRKPDFRLFKNKGTDQLQSNYEADQHLCFHYTDSTILLLPKSEIPSFFTFFRDSTDRFVSELAENPKDWFSCVVAHIVAYMYISNDWSIMKKMVAGRLNCT